MYLLKVKVEGFPGEHVVGPFPKKEAEVHRDDISEVEGVRYAIIVHMKDHLASKMLEVPR